MFRLLRLLPGLRGGLTTPTPSLLPRCAPISVSRSSFPAATPASGSSCLTSRILDGVRSYSSLLSTPAPPLSSSSLPLRSSLLTPRLCPSCLVFEARRGLRPNPNKPFGMVVIRRRKMKKHKLKKWRKKFKALIEKNWKKRELAKEKALQAELKAYIEEGERYNPREHVKDLLERLNKFYYPLFWKGNRLPPHYVKQYVDEQMAFEKKKKDAELARHVENVLDEWEKSGKMKC